MWNIGVTYINLKKKKISKIEITPNPGQNQERGIFHEIRLEFKLDCALKYKEGEAKFHPRRKKQKKLFKSII